MKKIEEILKRERLSENPEFKSMFGEYQECKRRHDQARESRRRARRDWREAEATGADGDGDQLVELRHRYRQEKYLARYHRETFRLARHRLRAWIDRFLRRVIEARDDLKGALDGVQAKKRTVHPPTPRREKASAAKTVLRVHRAASTAAEGTNGDDRTAGGKNAGQRPAKKNAAANGKEPSTAVETPPEKQRARGRKHTAAAPATTRPKGENSDSASDHPAKPPRRRGGKATVSED